MQNIEISAAPSAPHMSLSILFTPVERNLRKSEILLFKILSIYWSGDNFGYNDLGLETILHFVLPGPYLGQGFPCTVSVQKWAKLIPQNPTLKKFNLISLPICTLLHFRALFQKCAQNFEKLPSAPILGHPGPKMRKPTPTLRKFWASQPNHENSAGN